MNTVPRAYRALRRRSEDQELGAGKRQLKRKKADGMRLAQGNGSRSEHWIITALKSSNPNYPARE